MQRMMTTHNLYFSHLTMCNWDYRTYGVCVIWARRAACEHPMQQGIYAEQRLEYD